MYCQQLGHKRRHKTTTNHNLMTIKKKNLPAKRAAARKSTKRQQQRKRPPRQGTRRGMQGRNMTVVTGATGRMVRPTGVRTGYDMSHGNAPPHPDLGHVSGHHLKVGLSPCDLYRGVTNPNACFTMPDGYAYNALTPSPIYITGTIYERLLGQSTPMQQMCKMYVRYALRKLTIHYTPTNGLQETGTAIMVWHPSGPTELPYTTFTQAKNCQGAFSFALNSPASFNVVDDNSKVPRLYYVDPTNISKEQLAPGQLLCFMDQADGAGRAMGQLWVELEYYLYTIQGNVAPSMADCERKEVENRLSTLRKDLALLNDTSAVAITRQSASTSSATTNTTPSVSSQRTNVSTDVKEQKEEKREMREDFYLVPRRV